MNIPGYEYIMHKFIERPWGYECRYTVKDANGNLIDDVVSVSAMDISEGELVTIITDRLSLLTAAKPEINIGE
jgi:hypothetical protein